MHCCPAFWALFFPTLPELARSWILYLKGLRSMTEDARIDPMQGRITVDDLDPENLAQLSDDDFRAAMLALTELQELDRKQNQLVLYQPASDDCLKVHRSRATYLLVCGGNGASKTDTVLAHMAALCTGIIPESIPEIKTQFRGPINCRVVVESFTTTLNQIILKKLQWNQWQGVSFPGGDQGHWGWVPKSSLIDGDWQTSYSEKYRTLRMLCRDPDNPLRVLGESTIQFMCLRGDQRVFMADGTWKYIKDIKSGEIVRHPDGQSIAVTKTYQYPNAPLVKIRCRGGKEIVSTPNHKHFLEDGTLRQAGDIRIGDVLKTYEPPLPSADEPSDLSWDDWELGWTALMIGDGYIKGAQASLAAKSPSRVLSNLPPLPPGCKLHDVGRGYEWRVTLIHARRGNPLIALLKRVGLWGLGSREKFIPDEVFIQPPNKRAFFLKHLWNTDGCVQPGFRSAAYVTTSRRLAYDVKYLLWGLGITAGITTGTYVCGFTGKMVKRWTVQIYGGYIDRFMAAVTGSQFFDVEVNPKGKHGKVVAIEDAGNSPVYCLAVDHSSHAFIVDGIVTHNSHEQDPSDFASGDFHIVMFDEPTKYAIWTENQARTMRVNGRMILSMTWPDDPAIPVDWIFDEVYEKGIPGPRKSPDHEVIELSTRKNKNLDQKSISRQSENWSEATRNVRILGKPIRFSNRIHALFTDTPNYWSFTANEVVEPEWSDEGRARCPKTGSIEVAEFCHVRVVEPSARWPHVFLIDPHPRKATMFCWVQIDPDDDYCMVLSHQMTGTCKDIATFVADIEDQFSLQVRLRLMDPNMAEQPAAASRDMETSWRDEYATAGLICDLASDSSVGRKRLDEYLTPDRYTYRPRFTIAQGNDVPIEQMKRYVWDDHKRALERDQKQLPKTKYDDYPTMFKYLMNAQPQFRHLLDGPQVLHREGMRPPPPDSHRR